ncbi:hypothetical protein [Thermopetrobacter sp. TC1]|uniref:hypothetical protein n=1 Tax=Thermopetrobacter sp. TC1 TaxID=1495045 RepID=UPI0009E009F2|nr:hypothetical protein [Thermopetrobacter sp. TC1]
MSIKSHNSDNYIYASSVPWGIEVFMHHRKSLPGSWYVVCSKQDLEDVCAALNYDIRFAFFPHWSYIVPDHIINKIECVCFHMTDLPFGRGGSPLQNLILRGHKKTKISALRMVKELDAGPIYLKKELDLSGSAFEIYKRATSISIDMMKYIISKEPDPIPQKGTPTFFKRRKPEQSILPKMGELENMYDYIRMLDAPGYPHAFLEYGEFQFEFTDAEISDNEIIAKAIIRKKKNSLGGDS